MALSSLRNAAFILDFFFFSSSSFATSSVVLTLVAEITHFYRIIAFRSLISRVVYRENLFTILMHIIFPFCQLPTFGMERVETVGFSLFCHIGYKHKRAKTTKNEVVKSKLTFSKKVFEITLYFYNRCHPYQVVKRTHF